MDTSRMEVRARERAQAFGDSLACVFRSRGADRAKGVKKES